MNRLERKRLMKVYGGLYKRVGCFDWSKCAYCDRPMRVYDHVPPISIVEGLDIKVYRKRGGEFRLYPSCAKCNRYLRDYPPTDFYERLDYLIRQYEKRLNRIEHWSEEELSEMGYNMRTHIIDRQKNIGELSDICTALVEKYCSDEFADLL